MVTAYQRASTPNHSRRSTLTPMEMARPTQKILTSTATESQTTSTQNQQFRSKMTTTTMTTMMMTMTPVAGLALVAGLAPVVTMTMTPVAGLTPVPAPVVTMTMAMTSQNLSLARTWCAASSQNLARSGVLLGCPHVALGVWGALPNTETH